MGLPLQSLSPSFFRTDVIPNSLSLRPVALTWGKGQRERTRMQQTTLETPELYWAHSLNQGSCTAKLLLCNWSSALPRLCELAPVPPEDSYFCSGAAARVALAQLFVWPRWALWGNKAAEFLFAQWAINEMEKWQKGHASAAEQEQVFRADLANAVHPQNTHWNQLGFSQTCSSSLSSVHLFFTRWQTVTCSLYHTIQFYSK